MALRRLSYGVFTVALILGAAATVLAVKRSSSTERLPYPAAAERDSLREIDPVDPNAGGEVPAALLGGVAGADPTAGCNAVGAFDEQFAFGSVYRGNAVRFDRPVALREFTMELKFAGTTNLYFSLHRRDDGGSLFHRFLPSDIVRTGATAFGNGPADPTKIFSTGPFSPLLELPPGEYAFAVAWGNATSVGFGRAAEFDPEFIPGVGTMLGTVNRNLAPPIDPLDQGVSLSYNTSFGLFAMEICLVAEPGACCSADTQSCTEVLETACDDPGDFFAGQRTTCDDVICRFGACCSICQDCQPSTAQQRCVQDGGTFHLNTDCPADEAGRKALCPGITGACCTGQTCAEVCAANCVGTFLGVGVECQPDQHTCAGACWICDTDSDYGYCRQRSEASCEGALQGEYAGRDTDCVRPPAVEQCGGTCCVYLDGIGPRRCTNVSSREACIAPPSTDVFIYLRDGHTPDEFGNIGATCPSMTCPSSPDSRFRCCLPDGSCIDVAASNGLAVCDEMHGEPNTSSTCSATNCRTENNYGACCFSDGSCELLMKTGCQDSGGVFVTDGSGVGVKTCDPYPCGAVASVTGACCDLAVGACEVTTELVCNESGRFFQGVGTDCADAVGTCPGIGACCRINGECFDDTRADDCEMIYDGAYRGDGSLCDALDPGCSELRACCTVNGDCVLATEAECMSVNGTFNAGATTCAPDTCPAGACCIADEGSCLRRREDHCLEPDVYLGDGAVCESGVCVRGACCHDDGTCEPAQIHQDCADFGDIFTPNVVCEALDPPCSAVGACCFITGICAQLRPEECADDGGTYQVPGLGCSPGLCNRGSCCTPANECQDDQFATSCISQGGGYSFHAATICAIDRPCDPLGACCLFELCSIETQFECEEVDGGSYQGDGSTCGAESCPIGACCRPSGPGTFSCDDDEFESECLGEGDVFHPGGDCLDRPCDPRGACCTNGVCEIMPRFFCEPQGVYVGDETVCAAGVPESCTIDPRYPHLPTDPNASLGLTSLEVTLYCGPSPLTVDDLSVRLDPTGPPVPGIVGLTEIDPATVAVTLDAPIPPAHWLCIGLTGSTNEVCVAALPGDVNGDLVTGFEDLTALLNDMTGPRVLPLHSCDIDRDEQCLFTDLLGLIDLLTGANEFNAWDGATLPECPSTTAPQ